MKIAYVVPRYGLENVGGAEYGARMLAERLVSNFGWEVEVFTTCAQDATTWADAYDPGSVEINGVQVHRFRSRAGRDPRFEQLSQGVLSTPHLAAADIEREWIELQGPVCPDVVDAAEASDAERVVFYPYLYYPTVMGVPRLGARAVMHPAAHDEAPLRLPLFGGVFGAARGLVFQTYGERRLVEALFPVSHHRQIVMGLGVEVGAGEPDVARAALGIGDRPYVLCVGRVDNGKGAGLLARYFIEYKLRRPGPLALVYAGQIVDALPTHPDIIVAGVVDEATKWGALRGAEALMSPSAYEAFSLVVIEAWSAGTAVVVNGACSATREHCARSGGGLWFESYLSFEVVVDRLAGDAALRDGLVANGQRYVETNFLWPVIMDRYRGFLEGIR